MYMYTCTHVGMQVCSCMHDIKGILYSIGRMSCISIHVCNYVCMYACIFMISKKGFTAQEEMKWKDGYTNVCVYHLQLYIYIYIYIHTHTHTCIMYIHTHTHTHTTVAWRGRRSTYHIVSQACVR